jgi:lysozyme family protein
MASYSNFHNTVSQLEGGFQNLASDPGNYNSRNELVGTNYGISAPVYEDWLGYVPSENDMRSLTKTIASEIFKNQYWNRLSASSIYIQPVAENFVDHGINAGTGTAAKIMQRVLNTSFGKSLTVDGAVGNLTIAAINSVSPIELFKEFSAARLEHYANIGNSSWLHIWQKRVQTLADKFGIDLKKKVQL